MSRSRTADRRVWAVNGAGLTKGPLGPNSRVPVRQARGERSLEVAALREGPGGPPSAPGPTPLQSSAAGSGGEDQHFSGRRCPRATSAPPRAVASCLHTSPLLENGNDPWRDPTRFQERHPAAAASLLDLKKEVPQKKMGFGYARGLPGRSPDKASLARGACREARGPRGCQPQQTAARRSEQTHIRVVAFCTHPCFLYFIHTHTHTGLAGVHCEFKTE